MKPITKEEILRAADQILDEKYRHSEYTVKLRTDDPQFALIEALILAVNESLADLERLTARKPDLKR